MIIPLKISKKSIYRNSIKKQLDLKKKKKKSRRKRGKKIKHAR